MNPRKLLIILLLLFLAYLAWKYLLSSEGEHAAEPARDHGPELVLDRVWVDSHPERYTDYVHVMLMLSDIPMGIFQKASAYKMSLEVFEYSRDKNKVGLRFPQTGDQKRFQYKVFHCDDLPPFDLCLDLSANPWKGPKRYYSASDGNTLEALETIEADLRERVPAE